MTITDIPPVCPQCGNNSCLLYVSVFAKAHLTGRDKQWYESQKNMLDDFVASRMQLHRQDIEAHPPQT